MLALDSCSTIAQATYGRWVRFDHAAKYNLVPSFELQQWACDEYV